MKLAIQILGFGAGIYVIILAALYLLQDKMLFFPSGAAFGACPNMERYNAKAISIKDIRYYLQVKENPVSWIVVFHGNAGNACERTYFFDLLKAVRSNIVLFEYPGYGGDSNKPGQNVFLKQAKALIRHIKETDKGRLPIYLLGESIGTGVATYLATQESVRGLILISPYTSIAKVAQHHYAWLPVERLMRNKFPAFQWAQLTETPAVLFHGTEDDIIPVEFSRQQVLNFGGRKELIEIEHCGHNDILDVGEKIIQQKIREFIRHP